MLLLWIILICFALVGLMWLAKYLIVLALAPFMLFHDNLLPRIRAYRTKRHQAKERQRLITWTPLH
jgi:4-amino-4-deoxy-L-arabinose transferase-like glycosyltransferase